MIPLQHSGPQLNAKKSRKISHFLFFFFFKLFFIIKKITNSLQIGYNSDESNE